MTNLNKNDFDTSYEQQKIYHRNKPLVVIRPPRYYRKATLLGKVKRSMTRLLAPVFGDHYFGVYRFLKFSKSIKQSSVNWILNKRDSIFSTAKEIDYETRIMSFIYLAAIFLLLVATFKQQTNF